MEMIVTYVSFGVTILGLIAGLVTAIAKMCGNKKLAAAAEKMSKIYQVCQDVVASAEKLVSKSGEQMSGAAKKEYAMNAAETALTQMGFKLDDDTLKLIDSTIENVVTLTKDVNAKVKAQS